MTDLHDTLTVIDGLVISKWSAKAEGRTGIILGFQNTSALEDQIGYISLFKDLGVGIMQITYNTQNLAGAGCYEPRDAGLSGFGREVVAEMNRVGVLCDLSHVGALTSRDVILASNRPVAYTHIMPAALKAHPRNKSDEEIRFIADHDGFVGVTMFPPFLARGNDATVNDYIAAIGYVIRIAGEDNVGIGTDFTQDQASSVRTISATATSFCRLCMVSTSSLATSIN